MYRISFLVLPTKRMVNRSLHKAYLSDHHVAIKGAPAMVGPGALDMGAYLCYDRRSEGDVGHEVAIHDIDVQPVGAMANGV